MMSQNRTDNFIWTDNEIELVSESVKSLAERSYRIEAFTRNGNVPDYFSYHFQRGVILSRIRKVLSTGLPRSSVTQTPIRYEK